MNTTGSSIHSDIEAQAKALAENILTALARNPMDFGGYIANERFGKTECIKAMIPCITATLRAASRQGVEEFTTGKRGPR